MARLVHPDAVEAVLEAFMAASIDYQGSRFRQILVDHLHRRAQGRDSNIADSLIQLAEHFQPAAKQPSDDVGHRAREPGYPRSPQAQQHPLAKKLK